jgi:hypothetical protein
LIVFIILAAGLALGYTSRLIKNRPQFDPSSPGTQVSENKEAGFTFLYSKGFRYDKERMFGSTVVNAKSTGTLILEDGNPRPPYVIDFTVINHTEDAGVFWYLNRYPRRETLSVAGKTVTGYIEQYTNIWGFEHYEEIVVIPFNGADYFVQYISDSNPHGTGEKYLDVFHQIIATMKFSRPTSPMSNQESSSPAIPSLPSS